MHRAPNSATASSVKAKARTPTSPTPLTAPSFSSRVPIASVSARTNRSASGPIPPFTAPEPELGLVLNSKADIVGYTLGNDVSAWDIEREERPLSPTVEGLRQVLLAGVRSSSHLTKSMTPYQLEMSCAIRRRGELTFEGKASTSQLRRKFEELVEYVSRGNSFPAATVLLTGTGIIVTQEAALAPGDVVTIDVPEIGSLVNSAVSV